MKQYDVLVIGAGIIGSAIAWKLSHYEGRFAIVDAAPDVATGTTKGTGGLIHAGYDPMPGTLKALLNVRGSQIYEEVAAELHFPYKKVGSLVVGFNEEDEAYLKMLMERGAQNHVADLELVYGSRIFELEPMVNPEATCALYSPHTAITDPYETAIAFAESACLNETEYFFNSPVKSITRHDDGFIITAGEHTIYAKYLVNAAGCYADEISAMAGDNTLTISCRHGDLLIYDKTAKPMVSLCLYPVPTATSKGIAVVPTISGNLSVGSTSTFREKGDLNTYADGLQALKDGAAKLVPEIDNRKIIRPFAGLRAVANAETNDFFIKESEMIPGLFHAAGIQSPGISSAPAIAEYIIELLQKDGPSLIAKNPNKRIHRTSPKDTSTMSKEMLSSLIDADPDFGEIVCRCEFVTKGEILEAIHRKPFGAVTVDGVKRRTRAGMGRCQGGFCQHKVLHILAEELGIPPEQILKEHTGSNIVFGPVKGGHENG